MLYKSKMRVPKYQVDAVERHEGAINHALLAKVNMIKKLIDLMPEEALDQLFEFSRVDYDDYVEFGASIEVYTPGEMALLRQQIADTHAEISATIRNLPLSADRYIIEMANKHPSIADRIQEEVRYDANAQQTPLQSSQVEMQPVIPFTPTID